MFKHSTIAWMTILNTLSTRDRLFSHGMFLIVVFCCALVSLKTIFSLSVPTLKACGNLFWVCVASRGLLVRGFKNLTGQLLA